MTPGELSLAVLYPAVTVAVTVLAIRSQYRARSSASSRRGARSVAVGMSVCCAIMILAGARWWLLPDWPSLAILSVAAAAVLAALWIGPSPRDDDRDNAVGDPDAWQPAWFGSLGSDAEGVEDHSMAAIRRSIVKGRLKDDEEA